MATAYYKCAKCGVECKIYRSGNRREAERYARYLEQQGRMCDDCFKADHQAQYEASVTAAAADPRTAALPPLTGTEKQIAWAQALRLEALPRIEAAGQKILVEYEARTKRMGLSATATQEVLDAAHLITIEMRDRQAAQDWIDARTWPEQSYDTHIREQLQKRGEMLMPTAHAEIQARR